MDKLEPLLVFGLFLVPSICFYRFCRKSLLPWWRHILFLLPGSQGAALAVILRTMRDFPEESGGARWLVLLLIPLQLGADVLLLRLLDRLERGCRARERQAELEQELARMEAYYASLQKTEQTVRRLRHDINNQLQTIGRHGAAYRLLYLHPGGGAGLRGSPPAGPPPHGHPPGGGERDRPGQAPDAGGVRHPSHLYHRLRGVLHPGL